MGTPEPADEAVMTGSITWLPITVTYLRMRMHAICALTLLLCSHQELALYIPPGLRSVGATAGVETLLCCGHAWQGMSMHAELHAGSMGSTSLPGGRGLEIRSSKEACGPLRVARSRTLGAARTPAR